MMRSMVTIVLPAYNEEENLEPLITKIQAVMEPSGRPYRILVVDDGSEDGTAELLERLQKVAPLHVVRHERNMGLAQTLLDGLCMAADGASPDDVVITMDADNTHDPNHIPAMLERLAEGYDVVIASRFQPGGQEIGLTLYRRLLSRGANLLMKTCFATKNVRDFTSGYRAYHARALQRGLDFYGEQLVESTTFAAMAEVLLKLLGIGAKAAEVPLVLRYDLKGGTSKMQVARTIRDYMSMVWRVWWLQWSASARKAAQSGIAQRAARLDRARCGAMKQMARASATGRMPAAWAIALAGLLLFGLKIGMPLTDGDTAFYARISQNIVESGDWQTLRFKDYVLIDKPPLTMWLIAASYVIFGVNEVAIRGWHVLMAVGTVLAVYKTALLFYPQRTASLGAWILLSSALFVYAGIVPQQDMPLTFFLALGLYGFARFLRGDGWQHTYTFSVATALGVLARGMQSFVLAIGIASTALLLLGYKRWSGLMKPWSRALLHIGAGLALCVLIAAPWFVLEYHEHGAIVFETFFGVGNSRFFDSPDEKLDLVRFLAYIPLLLVSFLPWSGLIFPSVANFVKGRQWRSGRDDAPDDPEGRLAKTGDTLFFVWFLAAFAIPWLIDWRVIRYLLPAIPPLAVMTARYLTPYLEAAASDRKTSGGIRLAAMLGIIVVLLTLVLTIAVLANAVPPEQQVYVPMVLPWLLTLAASMLFFAWAGWTRRYRWAVNGLVVGGIVTLVILLSALQTFMVEINPWKEAASVVNEMSESGERVVWVGDSDNWFLDFYVDRWVDRARAVGEDAQEFIGSWWIGTPAEIEILARAGGFDIEHVWQRGEIVVVRAQ